MNRNNITPAAFTGRWIGETQGHEMAAHLWNITQLGSMLWIETCWEGETNLAYFRAELVDGEPAFRIPGFDVEYKATLLDSQHFVIPDWCWTYLKNPDGTKASLDVVFSRPGIAELTARHVYLQSLNKRDDNAG